MRTHRAPSRLAGKVAIVTGATKQSGATIVERLADEGAAVACLGRSVELGEAVARSIRGRGAKARFFATDVGMEHSVASAVEAAITAFGRLDIIVNHAAATDILRGGSERPAAEEPSDTFDRMMKVNVYGPFFLAKYGVPHMVKAGGGSIISVSSIGAQRPGQAMPGYAASKAALEGLTRQMAADYGRVGIRVNAIALGAMLHAESASAFAHPGVSEAFKRNSMVGRLGTPADLAAMIAYLAADESSFVTAAILPLDGGAGAKYPGG